MGDPRPSGDRRFGGWRRELRAFLELFALTGLVVAQPAYDALQRNSMDVLVAGAATRGQVLALVAVLLVIPPLVLWAVEAVVGLIPGTRRFAHAALVGLVVGVFVLELLTQQTDLRNQWKLVAAVPVAIGAGFLVLRLDVVRTFLRYLAVAPVVLTALFLLHPQVSPVVIASPPADHDVDIGRPNRVVMVVLDEAPLDTLLDGEGRVDAELFPSFAALAGDATWYRNATTVAPHTTPAVPALLSGTYPEHPKQVSTATEHPDTLFTLLGDTYEINAHENLETLNPGGDADGSEGLGWLLDRTYELWKPKVWTPSRSLATVSAETIPSDLVDMAKPSADRFVESLTVADGPRLDYLHVMLPHVPWHHLPDGRTYTDRQIEVVRPDVWSDAALGASARQRYLLQLQATDAMLGRIVDRLRELGEYDDTLLVVTADHGAGFTDKHPVRKATAANYPEIMWVPLLVKAPRQAVGRVDDRPALSIDVLPTIADTLDVEIPWPTDGRSLLGRPRRDGPRKLLEMPSVHLAELPSKAVYQEWDGPAGFERVLASRAAVPGGDPDLRIYRGTTPFSGLVGERAAPLVDATVGGTVTGTLDAPGVYRAVDPASPTARWSYAQGTIGDVPGRILAVAVNGTIASLTTSTTSSVVGGSWFAVLPPSRVRAGDNEIAVYAVHGTPEAPRLQPVRLANVAP